MGVYLTFNIAAQVFALPVAAVESVLELPEVTRIPGDGAVKGLFNLRGAAVPLVDLKERLGMGSTDLRIGPSVVVLSLEGGDGRQRLVGALADGVNEVAEFSDAERGEGELGGVKSEFLSGLVRRGESFVLCLEPSALVAGIVDGAFEREMAQ